MRVVQRPYDKTVKGDGNGAKKRYTPDNQATQHGWSGTLFAGSVAESAKDNGALSVADETIRTHEKACPTLYRSWAFRETEPYYVNPLSGVSYMKLDLGTTEFIVPRS
jgi:hypothetical protein